LEDDSYKLFNFDNADLGSNFIDFDEKLSNIIYINSISKVFFP
jgi:DNA-binding transcriptional MocR family regulator